MYTSLESAAMVPESLYFWAMTTITEAEAEAEAEASSTIAEAAIATVTDLLLFWLAKRQARRSSRRSTISPTTRTDIVLTHLSVQVYQHLMKNPKCESMSKVTYPRYHDPLLPSTPFSNEAVSVKDDGTLSSQIVVAIEFPAIHTTPITTKQDLPKLRSALYVLLWTIRGRRHEREIASSLPKPSSRLYQGPLLLFDRDIRSYQGGFNLTR
ncbi:hypothetical protein V1478_002644 [Vespula squamosa]|uniref:Uncharacterized protein n=1 Tax=Vespula squamosa TaxID=30214 RepID=A0ABD2BTE8_VESSQ